MNNEQQTYVLRKPVGYKVRNEDANEFVEWRLLVVDGEEFQPITKGNFDALFQPFDVSGLTRQVEELLQNYGARFFADYEIDRIAYKENIEAQEAGGRMESRARKEFAEQIVLLFLNQEGESK